MTNNNLRLFIINLLDDEHGVNQRAFPEIVALCNLHGWKDIMDAVTVDNHRAFLYEQDAHELRHTN